MTVVKDVQALASGETYRIVRDGASAADISTDINQNVRREGRGMDNLESNMRKLFIIVNGLAESIDPNSGNLILDPRRVTEIADRLEQAAKSVADELRAVVNAQKGQSTKFSDSEGVETPK